MSKISDQPKLEKLVSLAKRRGFVFQASEIYGGISGFYDYGPYGSQMVKNIKDLWWKTYVEDVANIHGIDGAIIQHPKLWEASGHIAGFNDPLVDCKSCNARHRADHLAGEDSGDLKKLTKLVADKACPNCGKKGEFTEVRQFNMMMKTFLGPLEDEDSKAYLRPETAGAIFTNFELVRETTRSKIPFGIAQIGKAFRNEISPRDFIFRLREFEQMEMQYFVNPENADKEYENLRTFDMKFMTDVIGLSAKNLQWHEHDTDERAHYAKAAHDIQFNFNMGFQEIHGTHNRTDFDLAAHAKFSSKDLTYFDQESGEKYTPYVMESSTGVERLFLAVLSDAYTEEKVAGETRVVLKLDPKIAPVKVAVLPLVKNKPELVKKAHEVFVSIQKMMICEYDEAGSIGKRYRRQDEIGTPYCVTIDFESLDDDCVTVRDRDTLEQKRVSIAELPEALTS